MSRFDNVDLSTKAIIERRVAMNKALAKAVWDAAWRAGFNSGLALKAGDCTQDFEAWYAKLEERNDAHL